MSLFKKKIVSKEIDFEETIFDFIVKKKEEKKREKESRIEIPIQEVKKVEFLFVFLIFILFFQILNIQFLKASYFKDLEKKQSSILKKIEAKRGLIFDRNFIPLVENKTSFNLILNKELFSKFPQEETIDKISKLLGIEKEEVKNKIEKSSELKIELFKNLDQKRVILVESEKKYFPFLEIRESDERFYPQGKYFSHLLGYLNQISSEEWEEKKGIYDLSDKVGIEGVEKEFEELLRKKKGFLRIEKNVKGEVLGTETISASQPGKNIVLTIDSKIQKKLGEIMEKQLENLGLKKGAAVFLNVKTGEVLSLISFPSYDNNAFSRGEKEEIKRIFEDKNSPLFNRALKGQYPIGSVIKPFLALASLQEKLIDEKTTIDDWPGYISIPHRYLPDVFYQYRDWKIHGLVNVRKAIAESCNIFFYAVGGGWQNIQGLGPTRIEKYLSLFGFGEKTGIEYSDEKSGFIPTPSWKKEKLKQGWWDGDTYLLSIGQGYFQATPLQVAVAVSTIANEGKLLKPHLLKEIRDPKDDSLIEESKSEIKREINIENQYFKVVKEGMRWAVTGENSPSASAYSLFPLPVAAKTGTAEVMGKNYYDIWVATLAPYDNPEVVLVVMIEESPTLSVVALPIVREFFDWYFQNGFSF